MTMKYLMHLTEEDFERLIDQMIAKRIKPLESLLVNAIEQHDNNFLKIEEVVAKLHVTDRTIRNWVKMKKLKCYWIGNRQFFLMKDIIASMESNKI